MTQFIDLPMENQLIFIRRAADHFDVSDMIIEKDLWVCWLLEQLFSLPIKMAFKGGTSLSKVFGLIKRFSEDCDITIDYINFIPELEVEHLSRSQLKKIGSQLKEQLKRCIVETVKPYLESQIAKILPGGSFKLTLSDDGEQLRFYYPSVIGESLNYLRDHVFIEFGVRNSTEPCEKYSISPYLAEVLTEDLVLPKPIIDTLSPIRTFWEKATLIHVECQRDRLDKNPERLSRHWYDLFMLNNSWVGARSLTDIAILKSVIEHKKAFFNSSNANYDDCLLGKFKLIPEENYVNSLFSDFKKMLDAGMFHEEPPTFEAIVVGLRVLELQINGNVRFQGK